MVIKEGVFKQLTLLFIVLFKLANSAPVESNKYQEFVQIQDANGSLLCAGVIIDPEYIATSAECLQGQYAHQVKESDGYKLVVHDYRNVEGLALLKIQPQYAGNAIPTGLAEPLIDQKCTVIGWDYDHNDNASIQSLIEVNYTNNFFDTIIQQHFDTICETPSIKAIICNGYLSSFLLKKCNNGTPNYSHIEIYKYNEWINQIYKCAVNHDASCNSFDANNIQSTTPEMDLITTTTTSTAVTTTSTTSSTTTTRSTTPSTSYITESYMNEKYEEHLTFKPEHNVGTKLSQISGLVLYLAIFCISFNVVIH